jgi:hypothetical protein
MSCSSLLNEGLVDEEHVALVLGPAQLEKALRASVSKR